MKEGDALSEQGGHSIWEVQDKLRPPLVSSPENATNRQRSCDPNRLVLCIELASA